jgi:hypothetical protein
MIVDSTVFDPPTRSEAPAIRLPLHIDSTMRSCFVSCPQKFYREFIEGYRPPGVSIDLHAGACFALALEVVYREIWEHNATLPDALASAHAAFCIAWGDVVVPEWKRTAKTMDRVWEAVEDYFRTYSPRTDHVQPYFSAEGKPTVEYTFAIPLEPAGYVLGGTPKDIFPTHPSGSPFVWTGRFDMLAMYNGRPMPKDDKTTGGSISQNWVESWDLRGQFLGYVWACQQCGLDTDSVCVRGIAIQKTQIVHAEAIKTYSRDLIAKWHEQLRRDLWRLRRSWDEGYWDYNLGDACTQYGHCSFMNVCASANPESWLANYEVRHWNPLNKNPTAPREAA